MSVLLATTDEEACNLFDSTIQSAVEYEDMLALMVECFDETCLDIIRHYEKYFSGSRIVVLGYYDDFEVKESGGMIIDDIDAILDFCSCSASYLYQWGNELLIRVIDDCKNIFYIPHILTFEGEIRFKEACGKIPYNEIDVEKRRAINNTFFYNEKLSEPMFKDSLLVEDDGKDIREIL